MTTALITGATGFVGRFLCTRFLAEGWRVRGTLLAGQSQASLVNGVEPVFIDSIGPATIWKKAVEDTDVVIHLAARVHVMHDPSNDILFEFRKVNAAGSRQLAQAAVAAGVKRLVFVSSIKVNGEESDRPYHADSPYNPQDAYSISKMEAELTLRRIEGVTDLEVVIVRPPLVYGPGVKANFLRMMLAVQRGMPLPLASISNRRSLIYVGNLADALAACATHPEAAGQSFPVSDGEDVSTPELLQLCAVALEAPFRLVPCPVTLLRLAGKVTGRMAAVERLTGSLTIDTSAIRHKLGWQPPYTLKQGLQNTAAWFKEGVQ